MRSGAKRNALATMPDLPKATYDVWVRGYGLVDSPKVKAMPGKALNLAATIAPDPRTAAQYYPANYWFALMPLREMKFDLDGDTGVDRDSLTAGRLEANLLGGAEGSLVKSVPELSDHAQDSNLIRRREFDFKYDGALDSKRLGLVGVTRLRLEQNLNGR